MEESEKLKLQRFVEQLAGYKGRHTQLVTVYIPAGANIYNTAKQIEEEKSTAKNIKSTNTRKAVLDSLERIGRHLRLFKQTPPHGLAIFAGNISPLEGQEQIEVFSIEPPQPLKVKLYRCDQTFVLEPLKEILEVQEIYGLIAIERDHATIGVLEGKNISVIRKFTSGIPGKTEKGGQCLSKDTLVMKSNGKMIKIKKVQKLMSLFSINLNKLQLKKTIVNDVWETRKNACKIIVENDKEIISSQDHTFFVLRGKKIKKKLARYLKLNDKLLLVKKINGADKNKSYLIVPVRIKKIKILNKKIRMIDICVKNKNFIANCLVVHNSAARYARIREGMAKEYYRRVAEGVKEIFFNMPRLKGLLVGGPGPTKEDFLKEGELVTKLKELVLAVKDIGYTDEFGLKNLVEVSQEELAKQEILIEKNLLKKFFTVLASRPSHAVYGLAPTKRALIMGAAGEIFISISLPQEIIDEITKMAANVGAEVHLISIETEEGVQLKSIGGVGAILRFEI